MPNLFDLIDPNELLQKRRKESLKAFDDFKGDRKGFALAGNFIGSFLRGQTDKLGFTDPTEDPELDRVKDSFKILGEIQEDPSIDLEDPSTLMGLAQKFRDIGNLEQSAKLIQRSKSLTEKEVKRERGTLKFDQDFTKGELDIDAKETEKLFKNLTKDARVKKSLADAGISEQKFFRLVTGNRRLAKGLPAQPSAAELRSPKGQKIDKTFDVGVDAVIERKLSEAGKSESLQELDDDDPVKRARNQIRSRAKQIKDAEPALSTEEAAERAFDDLLKQEEKSFFGLFGGDFKRNKRVPKIGERRRIQFQP